MEIKYQELSKVVNKAIAVDNIENNIITGLRNIKLQGVLLQNIDFIDLVYLFSSIIKGEYNVELKTVSATLFGIIYSVLPNNYIPEFLGPIGYTDDIGVIKLITTMIKIELEIYRQTESYKTNKEKGFDINFMFSYEKLKAYFQSSEFIEIKTLLKNILPLQGSLVIEETGLVQYNAKKDYITRGYQKETTNFFQASIDEIIYVFNTILYESGGVCVIKEKDIIDRIILPTSNTKELIKNVLDNAHKYYDNTLFTNFEKSMTSKFNSIEYSFSFEIIKLKETYFEMDKPKIDCYENSEINVYNVIYHASVTTINWQSIYEVINILRQAKSQNMFKVNYLIMLSDENTKYQITYNSISKDVRLSTFNTKDLFFERELEELIRKKVETNIFRSMLL